MQEEMKKDEGKFEFSYYSKDNLFLKAEDLKINDYTKQNKKEKMNRNYDFLFSESKSTRIYSLVEKYYNQRVTKGEKIKSYATLLRLKFIEKVRRFYISEKIIWEDINYLTSNVDKYKHREIIEILRQVPIVSDVKENNGIICIKTTLGDIKFSRISSFFPNLEFDDEIENIKNRMGKIGEKMLQCHFQAIQYSARLKHIGIDNDVVTANRYLITDQSQSLHSWNEFEINGKEHVLDYTQNIVMNKDGYYALYHIGKEISRIHCEDIAEDKKILNQVNGNYYLDSKTYLTCRDEIMRELQKNIGIFDEER